MNTNPLMKKKRKKSAKWKIAVFAILLFYTVLLLLPFYVAIVTSITSDTELNSKLAFSWWPDKATLDAYKTVFTEDIYMQWGVLEMPSILVGFLNTLWMTLLHTVVALFFAGMAAFAYSKIQFKHKEKLFFAQIATIMMPTACMTVPAYLFYNVLGWIGSPLPIIIPGIFGSAGMIFFLRSYFDLLPTEFVEAAKLDGLGVFGIYIKIMIPLSVPAFIAQFVFAFVAGYNNYSGPLVYMYGSAPVSQYTLQIMLSDIRGMYPKANAIRCATAIVAMLPLIIVYICSQKFFIEGISAGGVKG